MKKLGMIRQGDVLIKRVSAIPSAAAEVPRDECIVLANGEVTGHRHIIMDPFAKMFGTPADVEGPKFIDIARPSTLVHEEHAPLVLAPGKYEVRRQREYTPAGIVQIPD